MKTKEKPLSVSEYHKLLYAELDKMYDSFLVLSDKDLISLLSKGITSTESPHEPTKALKELLGKDK